MILPPHLDAALYAELVPSRPTPADPLRMSRGPSEQFRQLELARLAWALSRCAPEERAADVA